MYTIKKVLVAGLLCMTLIYHCLDPTFAYSLVQKVISVTIYNSYSGSLVRSSGNALIYSGSQARTSGHALSVDVSATTGSSYTISGSATSVSGSGLGAYTQSHTLAMDANDVFSSFQAHFLRDLEPYDSNILTVIIDRTPPSLPVRVWPINNSTLFASGIVTLEWSSSVDTGVWLQGYWLYMSLHPSLSGATRIRVPSQSIQFTPNSLPLWTLYWYVEAVDYLGNSTHNTIAPSYFHYGTSTIVPIGSGYAGGWAWWWWLIVDDCPGWDLSSSYYDMSCISSDTLTTWSTTITLPSTGTTTWTLIYDIETEGWETSLGLWTSNTQEPVLSSNWSASVFVPGDLLKKTLVEGYNIAQRNKYISMRLPSWENNTIMHVHQSPYVYDQLINSHASTWAHVLPIGYILVYASWLLLLLLWLKSDILSIIWQNRIKAYNTIT